MLSLAATITTEHIATTISAGDPGVFMHGPTFMANPLACRVAIESIEVLLADDWQGTIGAIEYGLQEGLEPCRDFSHVTDVRCLGAIGVVELVRPVEMGAVQRRFVDHGVWVRPFGRLVYLMPPYCIGKEDLARLCRAVVNVVAEES